MKPTQQEINELTDLLLIKYKISTRFLNILMDKTGNYSQITDILGNNLSNEEKVRLLINQKESRLFAGSDNRTIQLRKKLIEQLSTDIIENLFNRFCNTNGNTISHKVHKLATLRWHSGKKWASTFVKELDFPKVFAGIKNEEKPPYMEDIDPFITPPELTDFQEEMKNNLLTVLKLEGDKTRCIVSLPTGGGKTRTAVEAFIEWLQPRFAKGQYLIWIAQSEELCNQAIECIRQLWASKQFPETLRVYRYFGGSKLELSDMIGGVVVSSISQIDNRIGKDEVLFEVINKTGSVIIDEAHRATTQMYINFFNFCKELHSDELFPICGLTATPGRSFGDTPKLVELFDSKLFTPTLGTEFDNNPLDYFRKNRYLALPRPKQIQTQVDIPFPKTLFSETKEQFLYRMDKEVLKDLAINEKRNRKIIQQLLLIPEGELTLVYACTVAHAELIATILNYYKRTATSISADTPRHYRRKLLEQFKRGEIQFVVNFGVLTTGFDAPKTQNIVICRPTFSEILYEQIVGRGLRGPKFGGTEYCNIIDFCDNYERFGDQQAYNRFSEFWK